TGIVLAGRTGASFAAVIGSMQVNEEVDALTGFGISPTDFLDLPRVLGLAIMTPLLTLYSNVAGIAGGFLVAVLMLGISPAAYMANTLSFMKMSYVWVGLLHALVFGCLIALCGCYQGIRSGRNASAVGRATTSAVVNSIVGIIIATSIITIIFTVVDI
ncbi:MAG: ABC transporter permease, partial [Mailhella sp.]|nr:ABC transporter permease [Mailhella sp.]